MLYGIGENNVRTDVFAEEFHAEYGEFTGMSPEQFANALHLGSQQYRHLPYRSFKHVMQLLVDDAELLASAKKELRISQEDKQAFTYGAIWHDAGESYNPTYRACTAESYSVKLMQQAAPDLGMKEPVVEKAGDIIQATHPTNKLVVLGARRIVRADIANVINEDETRMTETTRALVDESMLKAHQDYAPFSVETFVDTARYVLGQYLTRDLTIFPNDENWQLLSDRGLNRVEHRIPEIARDRYQEVVTNLGFEYNAGVYPYFVNQEVSSSVTPEPWTDSPDPVTISLSDLSRSR